MWETIKQWYQRYFACPEAFILIATLMAGFVVIGLFGHLLAPILAALVFAFLLDSLITPLHKMLKIPRPLLVGVVYSLFLGLLILAIVALIPLLWKELIGIISHAPDMIQQVHHFLRGLPAVYPDWINTQSVETLINYTTIDSENMSSLISLLFAYTFASFGNLTAWMVYLVLIPLVTLFFLKDKHKIMDWIKSFLPANHGLLTAVLKDVRVQLGGYVNGKVLELLIVSVATYAGFFYFGLNYSLLLAFIVGLSVMVPYVGMVIVTIPVVVIGLFQWGPDITFMKMLIVFLIIQTIDGNVVVPLLYSSAVNLHPVAIIAAVLVFGGLWGFWGLFFAIPLATLVRAVFNAWRHIGNRTEALPAPRTKKIKKQA